MLNLGRPENSSERYKILHIFTYTRTEVTSLAGTGHWIVLEGLTPCVITSKHRHFEEHDVSTLTDTLGSLGNNTVTQRTDTTGSSETTNST